MDTSYDQLVEALREAGLKLTPQRLAVVQCLAGDETHPTAQELHERLRPRFPTMSMATVYNTLDALTRIEGCRELQMGGATRFDPNVASHDHAVCSRCGAIRDVAHADAHAEPTAPHLASCELSGFVIERVERIYRGVCASCSDAV
jgi:Fur family peroxide stress response transcriptional regulator